MLKYENKVMKSQVVLMFVEFCKLGGSCYCV